MINSSFDVELSGRSRSELDLASSLQSRLQMLQTLTAVIAAGSVFSPFEWLTYLAALVALTLSIGYAWTSHAYTSIRMVAEQARRAVVIAGGLGVGLPASARRDLMTRFRTSRRQGQGREDANYYDTTAEPSAEKLAEMIEQSAFWSADLHRHPADGDLGPGVRIAHEPE